MQDPNNTKPFHRTEQGYDIHGLSNGLVELAVVPALGAKIVSLVDLAVGHEWMWHPPAGMKLFSNRTGDDFAGSTMTGWDECIPTIAPCHWKGRMLPDHGEAWSMPWDIDADAFDQAILKTSITLPVSPLRFVRAIQLHGNEVRLEYQLENLGSQAEEFLWAMHPLLPVGKGTRVELTEEAMRRLVGEPWLEGLDFAGASPACAKVFAGPLREGRAVVADGPGRAMIEFEWDAECNNTLGLWLTRGGWNGHHHLAIEPTNGAPDPLADAAQAGRCGLIQPGETQSWHVNVRLSRDAEIPISIAIPKTAENPTIRHCNQPGDQVR